MKRPNITPQKWKTRTSKGAVFVSRAEGHAVGIPMDVCRVWQSSHTAANAQFIAAAPVMAKALERLLACPDLAFDAMEPESLEAMAEARAALIKAGYEFP